MLMIALLDEVIPAAASRLSTSASVSPPIPSTPALRKLRRLMPGQTGGWGLTVFMSGRHLVTMSPGGVSFEGLSQPLPHSSFPSPCCQDESMMGVRRTTGLLARWEDAEVAEARLAPGNRCKACLT